MATAGLFYLAHLLLLYVLSLLLFEWLKGLLPLKLNRTNIKWLKIVQRALGHAQQNLQNITGTSDSQGWGRELMSCRAVESSKPAHLGGLERSSVGVSAPSGDTNTLAPQRTVGSITKAQTSLPTLPLNQVAGTGTVTNALPPNV